ncbi:unnamed protein product [Boreogadus saida]
MQAVSSPSAPPPPRFGSPRTPPSAVRPPSPRPRLPLSGSAPLPSAPPPLRGSCSPRPPPPLSGSAPLPSAPPPLSGSAPPPLGPASPQRVGPPPLGPASPQRVGPPPLGPASPQRVGPPPLGPASPQRVGPPPLGTTVQHHGVYLFSETEMVTYTLHQHRHMAFTHCHCKTPSQGACGAAQPQGPMAGQGSPVCNASSGVKPEQGMASASPSCSEENLSCPICLEVLSSPVSTPCGHNFCRTCIETSWSGQYSYKCPLCNKVFKERPDLRVNFLITDLADQFRSRLQVNEQHCAKPGDVPCDICNGTKLKAVKSCLACLISYCHTHLEPHQRVPGLKRHQLVDPMDRLEDRVCLQNPGESAALQGLDDGGGLSSARRTDREQSPGPAGGDAEREDGEPTRPESSPRQVCL